MDNYKKIGGIYISSYRGVLLGSCLASQLCVGKLLRLSPKLSSIELLLR